MGAASRRVVVIGGGIVGLATADRLQARRPAVPVTVVDKEDNLGRHQSGRNSGVLHSGIYYPPGSRKAASCRAGRAAMLAFCRAEGIAHEVCGKVIVAVTDDELPRLERLYERGRASGVDCERIDRRRLGELEPAASGVAALHVRDAGIVDYPAVCARLGERVTAGGGEIRTGARVVSLEVAGDGVRIDLAGGEAIVAERVINCAGLHCDRVAALAGARPEVRIVPFRGEYQQLSAAASRLCRNLIYPVPDPSLPFLGVHLTRRLGGGVECGPNAVLALAREGYGWGDVSLRDLAETLAWPGFLRLAGRHLGTGLGEVWRSLNKAAFVRAVQRLVPDIRAEDLRPAPAGVRAQAVAGDGRLVDDFLIRAGDRVIDVLNAPSPAATASLAIGEAIAARLW